LRSRQPQPSRARARPYALGRCKPSSVAGAELYC
jgi:hypothetical protein